MLLCVSLSACAPKALYLHPGYADIRPHQITVLPILDHRQDKSDDVDYQEAVTKSAVAVLERKRYNVEVVSTFGDQVPPGDEVTPGDLASPNPTWLKTLGPPEARWILFLAVTHLRTMFVILGTFCNGDVEGYLFDKFTGELLWQGKGSGRDTVPLLLSPMIPLLDDSVLSVATWQTLSSLPDRS
jgi:hypothetical protein